MNDKPLTTKISETDEIAVFKLNCSEEEFIEHMKAQGKECFDVVDGRVVKSGGLDGE